MNRLLILTRYRRRFWPTHNVKTTRYSREVGHYCAPIHIHGIKFSDGDAVARQVTSYIPFYNNKRKHPALGYMTPLEYEQKTA